ncbi:Protein related to plant expansins [Mycena indigotica]|uniref:Protein related to plant expansins n=1 Tax=Mycena indigotica TaxID=2126181 RepID=A0A8H6T6J2_9AGAR|nr:Protein related to plant expansins [Mycena indigotica]KAF7311856.1 Protein related to plant expansins [Mycena indigotica]
MHYTRSLFATLTAFVVGALGESGTPITAKDMFFILLQRPFSPPVAKSAVVARLFKTATLSSRSHPRSSTCRSVAARLPLPTNILADAGNTIAAVIAEQCPACSGNNIDLTTGAFETLAPLSEGLIDVTYTF